MKKIVIVVLLVLCSIAAADGSGAPPPGLDAAKQACTMAINDPKYSESLQNFIDSRLDLKTIEAHNDAFHHIQKNESHVIYAYAAMWVLAALLVGFLFLRQQALKTEIATLKRDLSRVEDKA